MPVKYSRTIGEYTLKYSGYKITVPIGSKVSNSTACGADDGYYYWTDFHETAEKLTGFKDSMLKHDLTYYGINIPSRYCIPYTGN